MAFTEPVPEDHQWQRYYPPSYYGKLDSSRFPVLVECLQRRLYAARAQAVERFACGNRGRVLDIGCGPGHLLRAFQRRGWDVTGTEMSEAAAAIAREQLKIPVHVGKLVELNFAAPFDAIVMWHVLEHFSHPGEALRKVHSLLRPNGVFLVAVPNFGSLESRLTRDKWFHLDVPRHLTHFSRDALIRSLEHGGFQIESLSQRSLEYDFFSGAQSFLNRIGLQHNWLYNVLRRADTKNLKQLLGHFMAAPAAVFPGMAALLAGGSTTVVYARRV